MGKKNQIWYRKPAEAWEEVLPIGNGSLGAMIWGTVEEEHLGLNLDTLWSGTQRDTNNYSAKKYLEPVRQLLYDGKYTTAAEMVEEHLLGEFGENYLPMGNLWIQVQSEENDAAGRESDYCRTLNLEEGIATVSYQKGNNRYTREYFACYPKHTIGIRFKAQYPVNLQIRLDSELMPVFEELGQGTSGILMRGRCPEHVEPSYLQTENPIMWGTKGMHFMTAFQILDTDGSVNYEEKTHAIQITNATYLEAALQAKSGDRENPIKVPEIPIITNTYLELREIHQRDYKPLFQKVDINLGENPDTPTDKRLEHLKEGQEDPALFALFFQYGRYLLLSSSREGSEAANLQGIWNWEMRAPWSSNYTTNINLEMNYWPAQICNLKECMEPYFRLLSELVEPGSRTAKVHFGCRGFCVGHNTDYWRITNPMGIPYGKKKGVKGSSLYSFFMLSGQWLCQELWKAYQYGRDADFLQNTAFPILKESALFVVDFLTEYKGYYLTAPSASPENQFQTDEGTSSISMGSTIEMTIVRETFHNYEQAYLELLRLGRTNRVADEGEISDEELLTLVHQRQEHLLPYQIAEDGRLQEWMYPFQETEKGHRHISHAYGLFPGTEFQNDPKLREACRKSIEYRLENGGGHTGWSCAWIANFFAVLKEGEKAYDYMRILLTRSICKNLWTSHPPFQIDANFAGLMAMAQMFVQEKDGEIQVLPAIPKAWTHGYVRGLCLTDNREIEITWENDNVFYTTRKTRDGLH